MQYYPYLAPFPKASYLSIRNSTMALKHKAAFQPLLDYLMNTAAILWSKLYATQKQSFFSLCIVYLFDDINNHTGILSLFEIQSWTMTQGCLLPRF